MNAEHGRPTSFHEFSQPNLLHRPAEVKAISETTPVPHETPRIQEAKQVNAKTCRSPSGRSDKTMFVSIVQSYLNASENCIPACGRTSNNDQETKELVCFLTEFTMGRRMIHSTK